MLVRTLASRLPKQGGRCLPQTSSIRFFSVKDEDNPLDKPWVPDVSMDTDIVHGGVKPDAKTGAILTPVYLSTTFVQESVDKYLDSGFSYSRTNNPTVKIMKYAI